MKHLFKILAIAFIGLWVVSCEKDEDQATLNETSQSKLSSDKTTLILSEIISDNTAISFTWQKSQFNVAIVPTQQIEFGIKGQNFKKSVTYDVASDAVAGNITHGGLNTLMFNLGATPGIVNDIEVRLKTGAGSAAFYSNVIALKITPYTPNPDITYPKINVPGSYAGAAGYADWTPGNSPNLFSPGKNSEYRGFIYVTAANSEYKFTINEDWAGDKGDDGTFTGKLLETGEVNIKAATAGTYYIKADWSANTYSSVKAAFGIIGDATPTGWGSDTDFVYNPTTKTFVINSIALNTSGVFKFRANDDWAMKFQPKSADEILTTGNGVITYLSSEGTVTGDPNYKVDVAGNYKIELDLHNSANYKLTVTKL
ncbi:SusE domain-containing protein [Chryseobacterium oranimense]|uniref:SusE domain-containing protein n=1 Tax=Chryseobacterium oranimense TaxID=421058 RepID=UPI0021B07147|nr:SusE domain-containing protein [Chryseobacterium oranimense]UWX62307.1 SusE domain-containing protein [Chryseobacterium oranimense]